VQKHLPLSQMWKQLPLPVARGAGDTVPCPASPVSTQPYEVPLLRGWGWEQFHEFAECLKKLRINMLGKKINTLRKARNYKDVPSPPCFTV